MKLVVLADDPDSNGSNEPSDAEPVASGLQNQLTRVSKLLQDSLACWSKYLTMNKETVVRLVDLDDTHEAEGWHQGARLGRKSSVSPIVVANRV